MDMRNLARAVVPIALGAVLLAGCGGSSSGGNSANPSGKKTYTIAYQGPLSGGNAQLGINMANGTQLALEQANAKGDLPFTLKFERKFLIKRRPFDGRELGP